MKRKYINTGEGILILLNPCFGGGIKTRKGKLAGLLILHIAPYLNVDLPSLSKL
jgi:hypothetical protein